MHPDIRVWNTLTAPEIAILLAMGGTLPPGSWQRERRLAEARALIACDTEEPTLPLHERLPRPQPTAPARRRRKASAA